MLKAFTHVVPRRIPWIAACALLIFFSACGNPSSSNPPGTGTATQPPPGATTGTTSPAGLPTPPPLTSADWTMYHRDLARTGYVADAPDPQRLAQAWNTSLDGAVYAEPLVVNGHVIVVTEADTLYSLDAQTGRVQWRTNIGSPIPLAQLPCGNIDPLGITGTPVYDPASGLVFAVGEVSGPAHVLVGIEVATGQVRVRRSADPPGMYQARIHQQRAALALSQGMVYIAYGGLHGDCGFYSGWVVASRTDGQGPLLSFEVPTIRGGIWAASGPAVDGNGRLYISVGNGQRTQGDWDHSDSVLRLSPALQLEDGFAPDQWAVDNAQDSDLGSMGPVLLPGGLVYADGKSGFGYLLHADALGGVGGQALVMKSTICHAYGGAASVGSTIYLPCTEGLEQLIVGPGISIKAGWHAPVNVAGSPIVGGHTVYSLSMSDGLLYAFNSATGSERARVQVGDVTRFATPTLSQGVVYVGTVAGVVAVKIL